MKLRAHQILTSKEIREQIGGRAYFAIKKYLDISYDEMNSLSVFEVKRRINIEDFFACRVWGCGPKTLEIIANWLGGELPALPKRRSKKFRWFGKEVRVTITIRER